MTYRECLYGGEELVQQGIDVLAGNNDATHAHHEELGAVSQLIIVVHLREADKLGLLAGERLLDGWGNWLTMSGKM